MSDNLINKVIRQLQTIQIPFKKDPKYQKPDIKPFPVEFNYLTRCLHRLGDSFKDYKIMDITYPDIINSAIMYCVLGRDPGRHSMDTPVEEFTNLLGINVLVIGPDEEHYSLILKDDYDSSSRLEGFVIVYHSYDNLFYPIISLQNCQNYIYHAKSNMLLQEYLEKE